MKVYFAHPISDYGTRFEMAALEALGRAFEAVENPNQPHHQAGYAERGMDHFRDVCAACDGCVFVRFSAGDIGAGVALEVGTFLETGRPVWELRPDMTLAPCGSPPGPVLDRLATRARTTALMLRPNGGRP